jgi:hypothetical protein
MLATPVLAIVPQKANGNPNIVKESSRNSIVLQKFGFLLEQ